MFVPTELSLARLVLLATLVAGCGSPGLEPMIDTASLAEGGGGSLRLTPATSLVFGERSPMAAPAEKSVLLTVEGTGTVNVVEVYLDSTTSRAFEIPASVSVPMVVRTGQEVELPVQFLPYAAGSYYGDLVILVVDDGEERELGVALEGEGCVDSDSNGSCDT